MTSTGRNEPCHCGSGTKYKNCCERKDKNPRISRMGLIMGLAITVVLAGGVAALFNDHSNDVETGRTLNDVLERETPASSTAPGTAPAAAPQAPVAQPPGPAPDGKVWSAEHGHWHDASSVQVETSQLGSNLTATTNRERPQQSGTTRGELQPLSPDAPPPGMVWHEEHGHFHRADGSAVGVPPAQVPGPVSVGEGGAARVRNPIPQPAGSAPEGKVWSAEHGHWHDAPGSQGPQ